MNVWLFFYANFHSVGYLPVRCQVFIMNVNGTTNIFAPSLSTSDDIPSSPKLFFVFRDFITLSTSIS